MEGPFGQIALAEFIDGTERPPMTDFLERYGTTPVDKINQPDVSFKIVLCHNWQVLPVNNSMFAEHTNNTVGMIPN